MANAGFENFAKSGFGSVMNRIFMVQVLHVCLDFLKRIFSIKACLFSFQQNLFNRQRWYLNKSAASAQDL